MNIVSPQLLFVIVSALILLIAVVFAMIRDAKAVRYNRAVNRMLVEAGKARTKRKVSVLVELDRRADSIFPLLDHLESQQYSKLEVIVIIKHTAGKGARPQLAAYKRAHRLDLRLITHKAGLDPTDVVRRYAAGSLIILLTPDMKLSQDFFSHLSFADATSPSDSIVPKRYVQLDNTIKTAITAYHAALRHYTPKISSLFTPGIVYKRQFLLNARPDRTPVVSRNQAISLSVAAPRIKQSVWQQLAHFSTEKPPRPAYRAITAVVGIPFLAYLVMIDGPERLIVLGLVTGGFVFLYATSLAGVKAYSVLDKVSLILLAPLFMVHRGLVFVTSLASSITRLIPGRRMFAKTSA